MSNPTIALDSASWAQKALLLTKTYGDYYEIILRISYTKTAIDLLDT